MILDAQHTFSDAQSLTGTSATASTNIIDFTSDRNIGIGEPLAVVVTVDVALAGTSPTFTFALQADDNSGFSSATTIASYATISGAANMPAGTKFVLPIPADTLGERYLRVSYTMGGTSPTSTVTAQLQPMSMIQNEGVFPNGYTIS